MGQTYDIKCPHCKTVFEWSIGNGMAGGVEYHCTKCGKRKRVSSHDTIGEPLKCKCGGTFEGEVPIRCPKCNQVLSNEEATDNATIMMWD